MKCCVPLKEKTRFANRKHLENRCLKKRSKRLKTKQKNVIMFIGSKTHLT